MIHWHKLEQPTSWCNNDEWSARVELPHCVFRLRAYYIRAGCSPDRGKAKGFVSVEAVKPRTVYACEYVPGDLNKRHYAGQEKAVLLHYVGDSVEEAKGKLETFLLELSERLEKAVCHD